MKTKGILIAIIMVVFASFNLHAISEKETYNEDSIKHRFDIRVNKNNLVVLRADCLKDQKWLDFILKVYSDKGNLVYTQNFHQKGGIYRGFDMKELPVGKYNFVIYQNDSEIYSKEFLKSNQNFSPKNETDKMIVEVIK